MKGEGRFIHRREMSSELYVSLVENRNWRWVWSLISIPCLSMCCFNLFCFETGQNYVVLAGLGHTVISCTAQVLGLKSRPPHPGYCTTDKLLPSYLFASLNIRI